MNGGAWFLIGYGAGLVTMIIAVQVMIGGWWR